MSYLLNNRKEFCTGCKLCANVCKTESISFQFDYQGFAYPVIDKNKCTQCKLCSKICPQSDRKKARKNTNSEYYVGYADSQEVLERSTSGGIFSLLSDHVLNKQGYVIGHKYNQDLNVVCSIADNKLERNSFCGSKYVQSDMGDIYLRVKDLVKLNKLVLFSGTPCQIEAIKNFFNKNTPNNLILVDIVCHGVPSPRIWAEYLRYLENKYNSRIIGLNCRDKKNGWDSPFITYEFENGEKKSKPLLEDKYMNLYLGTDCTLRPSCYKCKYAGKERVGDISIADYWGVRYGNKEMYNENKGVSLLLLNTQKGTQIFNEIENLLTYKKISRDQALLCNTPLCFTSKPYLFRNYVFKKYKKYGIQWLMTTEIQKFSIKKVVRRLMGNHIYDFFKSCLRKGQNRK